MFVLHPIYTKRGMINAYAQILYGLPVAVNKIADLSALWEAVAPYGGVVRILIDHQDQIRFLEEFEKQQARPKKWSAFIKVDNGSKYVSQLHLVQKSTR
jgi:D-serine deaminase-like pyridoxal phosphate-dependent protein